MIYPKRSQYKYTKKPYRVRNWKTYEEGLRRRGDLTIWLSEDAITRWTARPSGKPGGQRIYTRIAIEAGLSVRMVYGLGLRQTEGFLGSLAQLLGLNIPIPDHTTLSRRAKGLGKVRFTSVAGNRAVHILIDSTGVKIHVGSLRRPPKFRAWRKLHLSVDRKSGEILGSELSSYKVHDATRVAALLNQIKSPLASACADGAYDKELVYQAIYHHRSERHPKVLIVPIENAQLNPESNLALRDRNKHIRLIDKIGKRKWHKRSGYSRRSMVENAIYRYKTIIGREMRARSLAGQRVEMQIGCKILNTMTRLGMPDSHFAK